VLGQDARSEMGECTDRGLDVGEKEASTLTGAAVHTLATTDNAAMTGIVVMGTLGLVDAAAVRFLRRLKEQYGYVFVAPTQAAFSPAVDLQALRYVLSRLRCVDAVSGDGVEPPPGLPHVRFPRRFVESARETLASRVNDDDPQPAALTIKDLYRSRPDKLVMLSGCFDLIHAGHLRLIELAIGYGPEPVVAALTTRGIRIQPKNTAGDRPFWNMVDRLTIFHELRPKPKLLFFDGPDCIDLIETLRPDVWVKEMRDRGRAIVDQEAALVQRYGGQVAWVEDKMRGIPSTRIAATVLATGRI
jgi:glycerol-3-phosphate cytidylyltransferase-like family protein